MNDFITNWENNKKNLRDFLDIVHAINNKPDKNSQLYPHFRRELAERHNLTKKQRRNIWDD